MENPPEKRDETGHNAHVKRGKNTCVFLVETQCGSLIYYTKKIRSEQGFYALFYL